MEVVKRHLRSIADALRAGVIQTKVMVKFLDFEYNRHEFEAVRDFSTSLGLDCQMFFGSIPEPCATTYEEDIAKQFVDRMDSYSELRRANIANPCGYLATLPVDYKGDAYLCCVKLSIPFFRIGGCLDGNMEELQLLRQIHPYCAVCRAPFVEFMKPDNGDA